MKKQYLLLASVACLASSSCTLETRLCKGQTVYHQAAGPPATVTPQKVNSRTMYVELTEESGHLLIELDSPITDPKNIPGLTAGASFQPTGARTGWRAFMGADKLYFPENKDLDAEPKRLLYKTGRPVLQSMTVALKVRPQLEDSLPSQTETGFNLAIAYGQKLELNSFRMRKNIFGEQVNRYAISFGIFAGPSATDLKTGNTDPKVQYERKAVVFSAGGFVMFGLNRLHMGYTLGLDHAIGRSAPSWLYQGRPWHGIALAFDLLK